METVHIGFGKADSAPATPGKGAGGSSSNGPSSSASGKNSASPSMSGMEAQLQSTLDRTRMEMLCTMHAFVPCDSTPSADDSDLCMVHVAGGTVQGSFSAWTWLASAPLAAGASWGSGKMH
jgi:hypothetical protein